MDLIKHIWYLIQVEREKTISNSITPTASMTPLKTIRTMLVSAIFGQIGSCFGKAHQRLVQINFPTVCVYCIFNYQTRFHKLNKLEIRRKETYNDLTML